MNTSEMRQSIKKCAALVKQQHKKYSPSGSKLIDINYGLPYLAINLPNGDEYFFQEAEAADLLEQVTEAANKFSVSIEDTIIWLSQGW